MIFAVTMAKKPRNNENSAPLHTALLKHSDPVCNFEGTFRVFINNRDTYPYHNEEIYFNDPISIHT